MKKWTALLVALMMMVLCAVSLAEETGSTVSPEAIALYSSEWTDGFTNVRIFAEEDHWRVRVISADGTAEWGVATCGPDIRIRSGAQVPAAAMIYTGEEV